MRYDDETRVWVNENVPDLEGWTVTKSRPWRTGIVRLRLVRSRMNSPQEIRIAYGDAALFSPRTASKPGAA